MMYQSATTNADEEVLKTDGPIPTNDAVVQNKIIIMEDDGKLKYDVVGNWSNHDVVGVLEVIKNFILSSLTAESASMEGQFKLVNEKLDRLYSLLEKNSSYSPNKDSKIKALRDMLDSLE